MATQKYTVEVQPDFIERQSKARPIEALAEIIWNGLDADASRVDVHLTYNDLGLSAITVADNGHGIPHQDAGTVFTRLGGSWKRRGGFTKSKNRMLHGFEGRGRFKVFALGRVADWNVAYRADGQDTETYTISIIESNIREVRISDKHASKNGQHSGVEVKISELHRDFRSLEPEHSVQEFSEIFALYLKDYRDAKISIDGQMIDPSAAIQSSKTFELTDIEDEDETHPVSLEIIEWRTASKRVLYLCNEQGLPQRKQEELARLLREASLSSIISAAKIRLLAVRCGYERAQTQREHLVLGVGGKDGISEEMRGVRVCRVRFWV